MKIVAAGAVSSDPAPAATADTMLPRRVGSDTEAGEYPPLPLSGPVSTTTPQRILGGT